MIAWLLWPLVFKTFHLTAPFSNMQTLEVQDSTNHYYTTMWEVKEPTHLSQRVGRGFPSVLVWSLYYFMIHGLGGLGEVANGLILIAAACGAYIIMLMSDLILAHDLNVNHI